MIALSGVLISWDITDKNVDFASIATFASCTFFSSSMTRFLFSKATFIFSFIVFYISGSYIIIIAAMAIFATADSFRTGIHKAMIFQYLKIKK